MRKCPHCGRPTSRKAARCAHCGRAVRLEITRAAHQAIRCPRCSSDTDLVTLATVELDLCRACRGLWFDSAELRSFSDAVSDATLNQQVLELMRELRRSPGRTSTAEYIACPVCLGAMSRANYASISGVRLHRCLQHGTWADHAAALRVIELMEAGADATLRELAAARREDALERRLQRSEQTDADLERRLNQLDLRQRFHFILDWIDVL